MNFKNWVLLGCLYFPRFYWIPMHHLVLNSLPSSSLIFNLAGRYNFEEQKSEDILTCFTKLTTLSTTTLSLSLQFLDLEWWPTVWRLSDYLKKKTWKKKQFFPICSFWNVFYHYSFALKKEEKEWWLFSNYSKNWLKRPWSSQPITNCMI